MTKTATLVKKIKDWSDGLEWIGATALYRLSEPVRSQNGELFDFLFVTATDGALGVHVNAVGCGPDGSPDAERALDHLVADAVGDGIGHRDVLAQVGYEADEVVEVDPSTQAANTRDTVWAPLVQSLVLESKVAGMDPDLLNKWMLLVSTLLRSDQNNLALAQELSRASMFLVDNMVQAGILDGDEINRMLEPQVPDTLPEDFQ